MIHDLTQRPDALILIIDDEETQRLLTVDTVEQEGFRIMEAANGEDGLKLARDRQPDLILLDVMMPGIDGFEVCRQIRADPSLCHTPVIIVTGREDTEDIKKGFEAGATDFLTKPVTWNLLPSRIRYVLRMSLLEQELRLAKDEAEKASEAKSTLLSTMGHELRTPLNAIIGFSELMTQAAFGPLGQPQYEEFVVDIHASGTRLLNAINNILEMVNCESKNIELDQSESSLTEIVDGVVQIISPDAAAANIQIMNEISNDGITIHCNEKRLRTALFNLVANAVKFSESGGIVRLSLSMSEEDGLIIAVSDNGIGISAEDLPRIMEPFEQADTRLSRKYEGLGLGIPLARALARLHGGDVSYESELDKGTTARLILPYNRALMTTKGGSIEPSAS